MRQRKQVNYNLDDYDNQIKDAIRAQNRRDDEAPSTRQQQKEQPMQLTARGELLRARKLGIRCGEVWECVGKCGAVWAGRCPSARKAWGVAWRHQGRR